MASLGDEYTDTEARFNRIFDRLDKQIRSIIMGAADDAVKSATDKLNNAAAEIDAEVQKLKDSGVSDEHLAGLQEVAQRLDDRTPDAPATDQPGDTGTSS